jgi:Phage integrase SAM-like domain
MPANFSRGPQSVPPCLFQLLATLAASIPLGSLPDGVTVSRNRALFHSFYRGNRTIHPRQIRYEHAQDYVHWRKATAMHNTARLELKFFSFLLNEAIRREYCERNSLAQAKVERQVPPEKPELSDAMMIEARQALANEAPWMGIVFEIMAHIGCRFAESSIPNERIDFEKSSCGLRTRKGDRMIQRSCLKTTVRWVRDFVSRRAVAVAVEPSPSLAEPTIGAMVDLSGSMVDFLLIFWFSG